MSESPETAEINPKLLEVRRLAEPVRLDSELYYKDQKSLTDQKKEVLRDNLTRLTNLIYQDPADLELAACAAKEMGLARDVVTGSKGEVYHQVYPGTALLPLLNELIFDKSKGCSFPAVIAAPVLSVVLGMEPEKAGVLIKSLLESPDSKVARFKSYFQRSLNLKDSFSYLNWCLKKLPQTSDSASRINLAMKAF